MAVTKASIRGINLAQASKIVDAALAAARERKLRPMTLLVVDAGGDLVAFKREDHTGIRRYDIAYGKAFGALVMNRPSRTIGDIGKNNPLFVQSLVTVTGGKMVPTPGGVLIKSPEGLIIGAVGSSGDEAHEDEAVAVLGVKAAGLTPEPEEPGPAGH
jgi:uncharacterized protein GlcG (DUF336 family)